MCAVITWLIEKTGSGVLLIGGVNKMYKKMIKPTSTAFNGIGEARCSSVVRAFTHGAMGDGPIQLKKFQASAPQLV